MAGARLEVATIRSTVFIFKARNAFTGRYFFFIFFFQILLSGTNNIVVNGRGLHPKYRFKVYLKQKQVDDR